MGQKVTGVFITSNFVWVTALAIVLSVAAMLFVRKKLGLRYLRYHHEVSDPLLACVGTLFAILLGFMVANAMSRFEEARLNCEREAGAVADIFRLSLGLPPAIGADIRADCSRYVDSVIDVEWGEMEQRRMSDDAWNRYGEIWQDCLRYEPESQRQANIHASLLSSVMTLGDSRRIRATQMSYQLPGMLWAVVLTGAVATCALAIFFGIKHLVLQIATTSLVTLVLCLNVFLLATYDDPFAGDIRVRPHAFEVDRQTFRAVLDKTLR